MSAPFTISFADGSVAIDGVPMLLTAAFTRADADFYLAAFHNGGMDHGNGYEWVYLDELSFDGKPAAMSLCFHKRKLSEINWSVNLPNAEIVDGWPTQRASDDEIAFVRRALAKFSGKPNFSGHQKLAWGEVWSTFDAKGGAATAGLRFGSRAKT